MKRKYLISIVIALLLLVGCSNDNGSSKEGDNANGSDFPTSNIEIVVPWSAGGSSDLTARALSEAMSELVDKSVVVVNREGAGGTIATTEFANQQPDAHKILFNAVGVYTTQPHLTEVQYDLDDFKSVASLTYEPIVLVVNADSEWETLEDLINYDGRITYGHSGAGGLPDLSQNMFFSEANIEAESVAYEGQNPAITALLGSHIDTAAAHPGDILQHVDSGDLRILGVFSPERYEDLPDVPTFEEKGFDIDMSVWKFLMVSNSVSDDVLDELTDIVEEAKESDTYKDFLETANLKTIDLSRDEILERLKEQNEIHGEVIKQMGLGE